MNEWTDKRKWASAERVDKRLHLHRIEITGALSATSVNNILPRFGQRQHNLRLEFERGFRNRGRVPEIPEPGNLTDIRLKYRKPTI